MELRNRRPADSVAEPVRTPDHRQARDGPGRPASPRVPDARPAPAEARGYDADAEFKRGVPRPPGYAPDDTGGRAQRGLTLTGRRPEPHHDEHPPRETPRYAEAPERDRADTPRAVVDRPEFRDPSDSDSPDRYGDPLTRPDGTRIPLFDGPPRREQARQGWAGDCGLIAALGAVAAHRPGDITSRVRENADGSYRVTLSEARQTITGAQPTGRNVELAVTPDVPIYDDDPGAPACADVRGGTAWCPIAEKAFAGIEQTWTAERRAAWRDNWARLCHWDQQDGVKDPRSGPAPEGYVRLHQGSTAWDRAEMLTQLTGQEAEVREFPVGREEWKINRVIRFQLLDGKPMLVSSRPQAYDGEVLPHNLEPAHAYEVTGVEKGKVVLRNPWNRKHPEPMESEEFARNMEPRYTTLA